MVDASFGLVAFTWVESSKRVVFLRGEDAEVISFPIRFRFSDYIAASLLWKKKLKEKEKAAMVKVNAKFSLFEFLFLLYQRELNILIDSSTPVYQMALMHKAFLAGRRRSAKLKIIFISFILKQLFFSGRQRWRSRL